MPTSGCLLGDGTHLYGWDATNRLTAVYAADSGELEVRYIYDHVGRRLAKIFANGTTLYYHYDGWDVLEETTRTVQDTTESIETTAFYLPGRGMDQVTYAETNGRAYYLHRNDIGHVQMITDAATGQVIERYRYDAYGHVTVLDKDGQYLGGIEVAASTYLFTSRRYDKETGLYYYRNRYFSAEYGRFISPDPLDYVDGMNVYAYVNGNVANIVDPMGTEEQEYEDTNGNGVIDPEEAYQQGGLKGHSEFAEEWEEENGGSYTEAVHPSLEIGWTSGDPEPTGGTTFSEAVVIMLVVSVHETGDVVILGTIDVTTNLTAAATGADIGTELSHNLNERLDKVEAVYVAVKDQGSNELEAYYVSGFSNSANVVGPSQLYNAATGEKEVFDGARLVGTKELSGEERLVETADGVIRLVGTAETGLAVKSFASTGLRMIRVRKGAFEVAKDTVHLRLAFDADEISSIPEWVAKHDFFEIKLRDGSYIKADYDIEQKIIMFDIASNSQGSGNGTKMFNAMLDHFGDDVEGIIGTWVPYRDKPSTNYDYMVKAMKSGQSAEEAARGTWTGKRAIDNGFTEINVLDHVERVEDIEKGIMVEFSKPEN